MQVSLVIKAAGPGVLHLGLVAFEFGVVLDPHEVLQDVGRFRSWELSVGQTDLRVAAELHTALMDRHRGLLGRRGYLWASGDQLRLLETGRGRPVPWTSAQVRCPATLVWAAKRVPSVHYRVPASNSLTPASALHAAVQQAVLLQGAFRALDLNKDFKSPKSPVPSPV